MVGDDHLWLPSYLSMKLLYLMILKGGEMALSYHLTWVNLEKIKMEESKKGCGLGQWVEVCHGGLPCLII
jgi:hypothetical protein